ncbi:MAG: aminotransferase class III-fold pyridoxal phosphate-dependent enzyme, partial [Gemmatimonadota bacterium]
HGVPLIADEIYTGMGRCGAVLASTRVGLEPDLVCLGKVLGGGLPLSACVGPAAVMDAWPDSPGEALHTSTFLGNPLACAAGVAVLQAVAAGLPGRADALGSRMLEGLKRDLAGVPGVRDVRGMGLLLGVELGPGKAAVAAVEALRRGLLLLPAGDRGEVVELSPPVVLTEEQEAWAMRELTDILRTVGTGAA